MTDWNKQRRMASRRITTRWLVAPWLALALGAAAEPKTIDGIVAVVNDGVVLASEVLERYDAVIDRLQAEGRTQAAERDQILAQILERLILESIQLQEAQNRGVVVDDETLTTAVSEYAAQNQMDIDQFIAALTSEGISYRGFRDQVRRQLTLDRVQREVVNRRVYVTEQDIDELLASPFFAEQISDEYRIGHILLAVDQGASPADIDAVQAEADAIVAELRAGGDFGALAVKHSSASTALEGGDLGWRKASRIPSLFAEQVLNMGIGEVAEPIRNSAGFHIVLLAGQRGASQQTSDETLVRHILMNASAIRSDEETRIAIEALRERILAGEDFAELAAEHSEDPGSALAGGELGWSQAEDFVREFQEAMAGTAVGELSPPFRSEFGWHILEVQGRRQQDASEEARRDYAVRVLHAQRFEERLQEWLTEIRDEAFVEDRLSQTDDEDAPEGDGDADT